MAACSDVPQPVRTTGSPAVSAARIAPARSAAGPAPESRSTVRLATPGSAAIMSVMWYGGAARQLGVGAESHGSPAPASGASGIEGRLGGHLGSLWQVARIRPGPS